MLAQELFRQTQLFTGLLPLELEQLATIATVRHFPAGEIVIHQNTVGSEFYIIDEGSVEVFIQGLQEQTLVVLGRGQVIGEMALLDQGYRSASVRATAGGCVTYCLERRDFNALCQSSQSIGYTVMRNLAVDLAFKLRHRNLTAM